KIADHDFLLDVFEALRQFGGPAPGPDGISYQEIGFSEAADALRLITRRIRNREYKPGPSRLKRIPKGGQRYRDLHLRCIVDRVVASAVKQVVAPHLERVFLPCNMGFRSKRGVWTFLAAMANAVAETGFSFISQDDIERAFDFVPVDDAIADYSR